MREEEREDLWTANDKVYHVIFCFTLTILFSLLTTLTRHPFLRRRSIWVGSFLSLSAGATKEAADHLGFFRSSGASAKDAVADVAGVLIACLGLSLSRFLLRRRTKPDPQMDGVVGIELV